MDKFKLIYRILCFISKAADCDEFNQESFTPERFKVSRNQFLNALEMLIDAGYIKGVELQADIDWRIAIYFTWPKLTLEGLRYFTTDDIMIKESKSAKDFNVKNLL